MRRYQIGEELTNDVTFTDPANSLVVDPTTVRLKIKTGAGRERTLTYGVDSEVTRVSKGRYRVKVQLDLDGAWHFRWLASGSFVGADERHIHVDRSAFTRPL